jgi:mono/diheme cytochrome c family protein
MIASYFSRSGCPAIFALAGLSLPWVASGADAPVEYNRDIRPILSDKCFHCHGPDAKGRKADLRLDRRDGATADLGGHVAVMPGKSAESEMIARILATDADEVMPPPATKKTLSAREIDLLKKWIDQGAAYQDHWAFLPIAKAEPPAANGARNPIDRFITGALSDRGLALSPEADAPTLIRRMSLDLTGLLPDPAAVRKFVDAHAKDADAAVKALAHDLLASPHYGERWGRHWLDQARYADSNGYSIDGERTQWPYRDWVIRAVNDDMPFDRFTIEQLAGDLLPQPTKPQLVATGFHRNTLINQEGGTDAEQFRNEEMVDRVNTTGAVWLGLTMGCAQCHTHKFDPITHEEYFRFFAFFNQGEDVNSVAATVEVSEGEMLLSQADPTKLAALDTAQRALADLDRTKAKRQEAWEQETLARRTGDGPMGATWAPLVPQSFSAADGAVLTKLDDGSILAAKGGPRDIYTVRYAAPSTPVAAVRLRVLMHDSLPAKGPGLAGNGNFILTRVDIRHGGKPVPVAGVQADHAQPDFGPERLIDDLPGTGWAINVGKGSKPGAKMNAPHEVHFTLAVPIPADGQPIEVLLHHELSDYYNVGRFAVDVSPTVPATLDAEKLFTVLSIEPAKRSADDKKYLTAEFDKADTARLKALGAVGAAKQALGFGETVKTMVMRDLVKPRETYIHIRGDFLRHDTETGPLKAGVPAVFPEIPGKPANPNRLDLARWLVRPDHPLTPRVTVNRVWMRYFGKGLVETENDFGLQGSYPTHPELLDFLAGWFVEKGWSMKALHELIVTSATYRQSSTARPGLAEADPLNQLLGRQNRLRVDAEIVRDAALSASGLLTPRIGGPGVMPPQPDGVYAFTQRKVNWVAAEGPDRYRRALYTRFYRSAPYPLMTTFDSPDFQSVCTARTRSNTPLQSLALANDTAMFELAQGLGERLMREVAGTDSAANRERIRHGWTLCFARPPLDSELETVAAFQELQAGRFQKDEAAARVVAPADPPPGYDAATAASWTAVARALMNTDEFITRE